MTSTKESVHFSTLFARFIFWTIAIIVTGIFILTIIAILLEKRISQTATKAIERHIKVPISFQSPSFSLIKGFPGAALTLTGVEIRTDHAADAPTLAKAEKLKLQCSIFDLIWGDYDFHTIMLENAHLNLYRGEDAIGNYHILHEDIESQHGTFNLKNIQLKNTTIHYQDDYTQSTLELLAKDIQFKNLSAAFANKATYIQAGLEEVYYQLLGSCLLQKINIKGSTLLMNNEFNPELTAIYSPKEDMFTFNYANFALDGSKFNIEGIFGLIFDEVQNEEIVGLYLDTKVTGSEVKFNSLIGLLPIENKTRLQNWTSNHRAQISWTCSGNLMKNYQPINNLSIQLFNATVNHAKSNTPFSKLNLDLHYTNEAKNNSLPTLSIRNFQAQISKYKIAFNYQRIGHTNPHITFAGFAQLPFNTIAPFLHDSLEHTAGLIQIDSFHFEGHKEDFRMGKEANVKAYVKAQVKEVQMHYNKMPILFEKGNFILDKQTLDISDWQLQMDNTNLNIHGKVGNVLANFLHKKGEKRPLPILFNVAAAGEALDVDNVQNYLLPLFFNRSNNAHYLPTDNLQGKALIQLARLNKDDLNMSDIKAQFFFNNEEILIQEAKGNFGKGTMAFVANIALSDSIKYQLLAQLQDINFGQWMQENRNFGQDLLTHKHLIGTAQGLIYSSGAWDKQGNWSKGDFSLFTDLKITEGYLQDYPPMVAIAKSLKIEDFKKIKIIDAYLQTHVAAENIYFNQILLRSDGYNMLLNGKSNFNQYINFKFKWNTASVLLRNIQMHNTIPNPIKTYIPEMYNFYMQAQGSVAEQNIQIQYHSPLSIEENLDNDLKKNLDTYFSLFQKNIQKTKEKSRSTLEEKYFSLQSVTQPEAWKNLSELN